MICSFWMWKARPSGHESKPSKTSCKKAATTCCRKEAAWINWPQIAGAAIVLLSFIPLLFAISYFWVLTLILGTAGLAVLSYGYVIAFRFDPNAGDPEPRKVLGQKYAVWGAQLAELLAKNANAEPPNGTPRC